MKSLNSIMSNVLLVFILLVAMPASFNTLSAAEVVEKQPLTTIRYVGKEDDMLLFDVWFSFNTVGRFSIADEYGNILFEERIQPIAVVKRFKIPVGNIKKLQFESLTKGESQRKTFVVSYQVEEKLQVVEQ